MRRAAERGTVRAPGVWRGARGPGAGRRWSGLLAVLTVVGDAARGSECPAGAAWPAEPPADDPSRPRMRGPTMTVRRGSARPRAPTAGAPRPDGPGRSRGRTARDGRRVPGLDPPPEPWTAGHRGVDLAAQPGRPVRAVAAGRVSFAGRVAGQAVVSIELTGTGLPPLRTTYEPVRPAVRKGDRVRGGRAGGHGLEPGRPLPDGLPALGPAARRALSRPAVAAARRTPATAAPPGCSRSCGVPVPGARHKRGAVKLRATASGVAPSGTDSWTGAVAPGRCPRAGHGLGTPAASARFGAVSPGRRSAPWRRRLRRSAPGPRRPRVRYGAPPASTTPWSSIAASRGWAWPRSPSASTTMAISPPCAARIFSRAPASSSPAEIATTARCRRSPTRASCLRTYASTLPSGVSAALHRGLDLGRPDREVDGAQLLDDRGAGAEVLVDGGARETGALGEGGEGQRFRAALGQQRPGGVQQGRALHGPVLGHGGRSNPGHVPALRTRGRRWHDAGRPVSAVRRRRAWPAAAAPTWCGSG